MIVEQTHKSLIHGVSQQHPNQRIEGQLSEMLNMHPDAVTGLRRRRGFKVLSPIGYASGVDSLDIPAEELPRTRVFYKEFSGAGYILVHNCVRGVLWVYSVHGEKIGSVTNPYLVGEPADFQEAVVSGFLGILNTRKVSVAKDKLTYQRQTTHPIGFLYAFAGDTDYNFGVTVLDYEYTSDDLNYGVKGTALYMTFETGSGTSSKIGKWFCTAHKFHEQELVDAKTPEQIREAQDLMRHGIATRSIKLDGGTEHSGNFPNDGTWYGHKITNAFGVTASGLIMGVEQVLIKAYNQGFGDGILSKYEVDILGSSLVLKATRPPASGGLEIRTTASGKNLVASGSFSDGMQLSAKEQLPPRLPSSFDGYVVGVGASLDSRVYWRYVSASQSWVEGVNKSEETELHNMPVMLSCTADPDALQRYIHSMTNAKTLVNFSSWEIKLDTAPFIGRVVGNSQNNPTPNFVGQSFTGIAGYQGRLVLMAGNEVYFSRSNHYNEFMRSTVQNVNPSDPVAIQNLNLSGTEFRYAVEHNRDLVLISPSIQAVVPYNNALTPQNAAMHFSSRTNITADVTPVHSGRELMYCTYNSQGCVQVGRFVPDANSEHHFTPELMTLHIPTYYEAPVLGWDANSLSGMVVICNGSNELLVQCNTYQGVELLQNAWGKWVLPYPVVAVWFVLDVLYVVVRRNDLLWILTLPTTRGYENYPLVDFWRPFSKSTEGLLVPDKAVDKAVFIGDIADIHNQAEVMLLYPETGSDDKVALEPEWVTHVDGVVIGHPYRSEFGLTAPVLRKEQYVYQAENASARWIASYLQVRDSGAFKYRVSTPYGEPVEYSITVSPQGYLGYGAPIGSLEAALHVNAILLGTTLSVYTEGLQDLNAIGATSAVKFGARRRHWR